MMKRVIIIVLLVSVLGLSGCVAQSEYDVLFQNYEALQIKNDAIQDDYIKIQKQCIEMESELESLNARILELSTKLRDADEEIRISNNETYDLKQQLKLYEQLGISVYEGENPFGGVILRNRGDAINVSWERLRTFLEMDGTNNMVSIP